MVNISLFILAQLRLSHCFPIFLLTSVLLQEIATIAKTPCKLQHHLVVEFERERD